MIWPTNTTRESLFRSRLASVVSVVGHPALVVPTSGLAVHLASFGTDLPSLPVTLAAALIVPGAVMLFAVTQTRRGAWSHVDASEPAERRSHNLFALLVLAAAAVVATLAGLKPAALVFAGCWLIIAVCGAASGKLKVSQHVAFAALASLLLAALGPAFVAAGLVGTALVGWSRLVLRRHVMPEVVAGALLGVGVGVGAALLLL